MKPAKSTKKKASARKAPKATNLNVNVEYVEAIADESIATTMAMRGLVRMQNIEIMKLRALVAELQAKLEARDAR
jgi:hypothetical protein